MPPLTPVHKMLGEHAPVPLLEINAGPDGPRLHRSGERPDTALQDALRRTGPVIIMVHGFKFAPGHARDCPHGHILSLTPRRNWKALSWPRGLGFGGDAPDEGLAIAFGWSARGTLWQAYGRAPDAARQLAELVGAIRRIDPQRPVHMIAHSLGARVVLGAVAAVPAGSIGRVILLNGADYADTAQRALTSPAGASAELLNVTTRENDLFDFLFERLIQPPRRGARCLAEAFPAQPNTLHIQLDHPATRIALSQLGFDVAQDATRICHWSAYLRPGLMDVYRALLRDPDRLSLARLRKQLCHDPDPRWSRLWPLPQANPVAMAAQAWLSWAGGTNGTVQR